MTVKKTTPTLSQVQGKEKPKNNAFAVLATHPLAAAQNGGETSPAPVTKLDGDDGGAVLEDPINKELEELRAQTQEAHDEIHEKLMGLGKSRNVATKLLKGKSVKQMFEVYYKAASDAATEKQPVVESTDDVQVHSDCDPEVADIFASIDLDGGSDKHWLSQAVDDTFAVQH